MILEIPWRQIHHLDALLKSSKIIDDQKAIEEINHQIDNASNTKHCTIDFNKITGDCLKLKNWIALSKPEWIYQEIVPSGSVGIFTGTSMPSVPVTGQVYYNTTVGKMMIYDGFAWLELIRS